ncbi:MAG: AAA family ATPase [Candidatus Binatia bacterium]
MSQPPAKLLPFDDARPKRASEPRVSSNRAFVGRDREVAELEAGLDDAVEARGRLFLVSGEPGIGKTRLADELGRIASRRGALVLWGRCWEGGGAPTNWAWVQILRSLARALPGDALTAALGECGAYVARLIPELRRSLPELPESADAHSPLDSESDRFRLFDAVTTFLRNACAARPLVLVVDDLHAADVPSLLLLRFVCRELRGMPMLLICTYRTAEARSTPEVSEVIAAHTLEGSALSLGGVGRSEVGQLITASVPQARADVIDAVHRVTEGNPLFVEGIARLLAAEGGRVTPETFRIPDALRESIRRRLRGIAPEGAEILTIAAVVGREFERSEGRSRADANTARGSWPRVSSMRAIANSSTSSALRSHVNVSSPRTRSRSSTLGARPGSGAAAATTSRSPTSSFPRNGRSNLRNPKIRRSGPLYAFPLAILLKFAAVPIGVARAAIDEVIEAAASRPARPFLVGGKPAAARFLRDEPFVQAAIARAELLVGSARSYLYDATADLWDSLVKKEFPSPRQLAQWHLAMLNAFEASSQAVQLAYKARGGSAVYAEGKLDRRLRDVLTMNQHVTVSLKFYEIAGRDLLGLEPVQPLL